MKTLSYLRPPGGTAAVYADGESIIERAHSIGQIKIDQSGWNRLSPFEVEITFHNGNGSRIHAKGVDTEFFTAVAKAIQEAERLK